MSITLYLALLLSGLAPPTDVSARDVANDAGGKIVVTWTRSPDPGVVGYQILRQAGDASEWETLGFAGRLATRYVDDHAPNGRSFRYKLVVQDDSLKAESAPSGPARASTQWFNTDRIPALVGAFIIFSVFILFFERAKRGARMFIRRIAGLDAVEEALGRATEMGRPTLYVPGLSSVDDVATIASLSILGEVAKKTAKFGTPLIVPNRDPIVYTVAREVVKESYSAAGRPDAFNQDMVFYLTDQQFAFAAAVDGIMIREKPATNFLIGMFWAESLILAETGAISGAVQIAGTDAISQLPFFITACDYTLIGEELYAASAYISHEPLRLGAVKAQDYNKLVILALILGGSLLALAFNVRITDIL